MEFFLGFGTLGLLSGEALEDGELLDIARIFASQIFIVQPSPEGPVEVGKRLLATA